jgi:hypothetical protein
MLVSSDGFHTVIELVVARTLSIQTILKNWNQNEQLDCGRLPKTSAIDSMRLWPLKRLSCDGMLTEKPLTAWLQASYPVETFLARR